MSKILHWLHISDIHFHPKDDWQHSGPRAELLDYLARTFKKKPALRPDLIFCTGDIAFGAFKSVPMEKQYLQAEAFFDQLLMVCGAECKPLAKLRLFLVPGNHDVNRDAINDDAQATLIRMAENSDTNSAAINRRFEEKPLAFQHAIKRLDDYAAFIARYLPHQADAEGRCFYTKTIEINGIHIGIAGFNSAWSCAGAEDDRNVWLPAQWQFERAKQQIKAADIRIGLMHHPLDWLTEADRKFAKPRISTDFDFWLHGHSHNMWVTPAASYIEIGAGAVSADTTDEFGINLVKLDFAGQSEVRLLRYKDAWLMHPIAVHAEEGVWEFELPKNLQRLAQAPAPEPAPAPALASARANAPPHVTPASASAPTQRAPLFGRAQLIKQTAAALQKNPLLLVYGMRGNGKTSLINALADSPPLAGKEPLRLILRSEMDANDFFREIAYALGELAEFPQAPTGDAKAISLELKRRYPTPKPVWLWLDRAHLLLANDTFRDPQLRQMLLGLNVAYGAALPMVLELRERPPQSMLGAAQCEVPGLDRASMGEFLAASAPPGQTWHYNADQLRRIYGWIGAGNGKSAHPLTLALLIEVARGHQQSPSEVLERHSGDVSAKIEDVLLGDLIGNVLSQEERTMIETLALYRQSIPHDHADWLERKLHLPSGRESAWDGINRRCLLSSDAKGNEFYLHSFVAMYLRQRQGYIATDDEAQAEFQAGSTETQQLLARNKHEAIAACWLQQLGAGKRKTQVNMGRALEAFYHLIAAGTAERVQEVAVELLSGKLDWALRKIKNLDDHLRLSGAPITERIKVLQYWLALDPAEPKAQRFLGECWVKTEGRASSKALACFEAACHLLPSFPQYWANLGATLLAQGKPGAEDFLQRLVLVEQTHPQAISDSVNAIRANCLKLLGATDQAAMVRMKNINQGSTHAAFYNDEAKARSTSGDHAGALQILELAVRNDCANDFTHAIHADVLQKLGRPEEAATLRKARIAQGSRHPALYGDAAQACLAQQDFAGALALLDLAAQNQIGNDFTDAIRASALQGAGRVAEACALRMQHIRAGSRDPVFYVDEAQALAQGGDIAAALALLDLAQRNHASNEFTKTIRTKLERQKQQKQQQQRGGNL